MIKQKLYEKHPDIITKIAEQIEAGLSIGDAARACGVGRTTIYRWIASDEDVEHEIEVAVTKAQFKLLRTIQAASDNDWRAAAWLLARRWPDEFGNKR